MVVDDDVGDARTLGRHLAAVSAGCSIADIPSTKVSKGGSTAAKLNDPFRVVQAQRAAHVLVGRGDLGAGGEVLKGRRARVVRGRVDAHADVVAGLDGESRAVVHGVVGPPFVPGLDIAVTPGDNASLEDSALARVACKRVRTLL